MRGKNSNFLDTSVTEFRISHGQIRPVFRGIPLNIRHVQKHVFLGKNMYFLHSKAQISLNSARPRVRKIAKNSLSFSGHFHKKVYAEICNTRREKNSARSRLRRKTAIFQRCAWRACVIPGKNTCKQAAHVRDKINIKKFFRSTLRLVSCKPPGTLPFRANQGSTLIANGQLGRKITFNIKNNAHLTSRVCWAVKI